MAGFGRFVPAGLGLVILVLFAVGLTLGPPQNIDSAYQDKPLPDFSLPPLYQGAASLTADNLRAGQPVLLNVFASWCAPCRVEHGVLMQLKESGVPIYAINYKDTRAAGQRFLNRLGNPYQAVGFDGRGQVALDLGVYGVPETFVIDANGYVQLRHVGPLSEKHVRDTIMPYFKQQTEGKHDAVSR